MKHNKIIEEYIAELREAIEYHDTQGTTLPSLAQDVRRALRLLERKAAAIGLSADDLLSEGIDNASIGEPDEDIRDREVVLINEINTLIIAHVGWDLTLRRHEIISPEKLSAGIAEATMLVTAALDQLSQAPIPIIDSFGESRWVTYREGLLGVIGIPMGDTPDNVVSFPKDDPNQ